MFIYLITILLSVLIVSKSFKQRSASKSVIISLIGILPLCLLAGYRDETVGHDLVHYMVPTYEALIDLTSFKQFLVFLATAPDLAFAPEPLWLLFHYIVSLFSNDLFWPFFIQQLMVWGLVVNTCYHFKDRLNPTLLYLTFLLYFYCFSMSANRQIFAIAIVIWSMRYVFAEQTKSNIVKFVLCIIVAWGFHGSGLMVILILPLYIFAQNKGKSLPAKKIFLVIVCGLFLYFAFDIVVKMMVSIGVLSLKYERYADLSFDVHKVNMAFWLVTVLVLLAKKYKTVYDNIAIVFVLTAIFMLLCGVYNDVATRFAMYLDIVSFISIWMSLEGVKKRNLRIGFTAMIFVLFFYLATTTGYAEAIPYTSKELGWYFD